MIFSLVVAFLQAPAPLPSPPIEADAGPVRGWLGTTGSLVRGQSVPVFVQAAQDGDLVVLHRRTDGRIEVLLPSNPTADPFVRSGTYEIRGAGDRAAWVVSEPDGSGMILAALSVDPLRFDEFVRSAAWNPNALVPSWNDTNAEGALSDIVQRMLGDGFVAGHAAGSSAGRSASVSVTDIARRSRRVGRAADARRFHAPDACEIYLALRARVGATSGLDDGCGRHASG